MLPDPVQLSTLTTLRVGGPAGRYVRATDDETLTSAVVGCDDAGEPVLVLGGGSNLLISDAGFPGAVVHVATRGIRVLEEDDRAALVEVAAGEDWDDFVAHAVAHGWTGVETLSGIPGLVGATPIQNVGAYGADVSATLSHVITFDRRDLTTRVFSAGECRFGYRMSRFKAEPGRFLVQRVAFRLPKGELGAPIAYPELARTLGVGLGEQAPIGQVRDAVVRIRAGKGMVLNAADHDTWSAGSFFTNPFLTPERAELLPAEAPRFPSGDVVKTSAAWLIQNAGLPKGYGNERAALSTKHVLALTNRGGATAADLVALATTVRDRVLERFGIELVPEVNLVGVSLGPPAKRGG